MMGCRCGPIKRVICGYRPLTPNGIVQTNDTLISRIVGTNMQAVTNRLLEQGTSWQTLTGYAPNLRQ